MKTTVVRNTILQAAFLALCATTVYTTPMMAQDPQPQQQGGGGGGRFSPERQLEALTTQLSLTPDQVTKVKAINEDTAKQSQALRGDSSLDQDARRAKMMDIRKASQDKIKAILTDDQKTKYDQILSQQRQRMGGGGGQQ